MTERFHSNGKLLLTAEYAVLDGALSLAVPTIYGQSLEITSNSSSQLHWLSKDHKNDIWFESQFDLKNIRASKPASTTEKVLADVLIAAQHLNPRFLNQAEGYTATSKIDFPLSWGLGTSSTLINNVANWAEIDAYELLKRTFGGSGYDIACAQHNNPLLFQLENDMPRVRKISFDPPFKQKLYFIYLNKKKDSREGISQYREQHLDRALLIRQITEITKSMSVCMDLTHFETLMSRHETLISKALGMQTVKTTLFPDYPNAIKSLGAWGGDFIMAIGNDRTPYYFNSKGYKVVIPYEKMVLS